MLLKVNFFLRVYDKFGLLVTLIETCIKDIVPFTTYFMIWQMFFILFFTVSGIVAPARAGFEKKGFEIMSIYVFENSIGNIHYPNDISFPQE